MIKEGWLRSVYDRAPAPLWTDNRAINSLVTLDHLVRMRSGLAFPVRHEDGRTTIGFENSAVYQDACDAFEAAQRSIVATVPGSVFRYVNSGMNVLGAIIRDQIERRVLPYYETAYGLLVDRLGMGSYQHSADLAGNLIASGAGYATLRGLRQTGRAVSERRRLERRAAAARGVGRLRADPDAHRHQLRRLFPAPTAIAGSPICRPIRRGRRARRTRRCSSCAGIA